MGDELCIKEDGSSRRVIQSASNMLYKNVLAAIVAQGLSEFCPSWTPFESYLKLVDYS